MCIMRSKAAISSRHIMQRITTVTQVSGNQREETTMRYQSYSMRTALLSIFLLSLIMTLTDSEIGAKLPGNSVAGAILESSGIGRGVCTVLGCGNPDYIRDFALSGRMYVHALDTDGAKVESVKGMLDRSGLYGTCAIAEKMTYETMPYANNMIDLIIAANLSKKDFGTLDGSEILRVLRPGGKAYFGGKNANEIRSLFGNKGGYTTEIKSSGSKRWKVVTKSPLEGTDNWSHWEHEPDNNPMSRDTVIRAPYMSQWYGYPVYSAMPAITTAAGGRTFLAMGHIAHHEREEKWINTLYARNGYNGTKLWERRLPDGYLIHRSAYVATNDIFYMIDTDGEGCLMLDPETGDELGEITISGIEGQWKWMAIKDGTLYVLAGLVKDPPQNTMARNPHSGWSWDHMSSGYYNRRIPWGFGTTIAAYDLNRRRLAWSHTEEKPIDSRALTMGGGRLYYYVPDAHLGCLDSSSGKTIWQNDDPAVRDLIEETGNGFRGTPGFRTTCICMFTPDALIFEADARLNAVAVSTTDGSLLWTLPKHSNDPNMLYADGRIIIGVGEKSSNIAVEPVTGKIVMDLGFRKLNCTRMTGTPDSFFCRGIHEGLARYDRATGEVFYDSSVRPACNDGAIGANGMLYMGPWLCDCNLTLIGSLALCSAGDFGFDSITAPGDRLETGSSGFDDRNAVKVTSLDWPTYRATNDRNAASGAVVSPEAVRMWKYEGQAAYKPTAPVAANGIIFLGGNDGKVRAVDATNGSLRWSYLTAGPIMRAPAIWNGRAYVGSGDGYVYCLDASNGTLLWRFMASPVERRIMVYDTLCSTWPVNSGVLIEDGVAYAAAGIIDYDGTHVYALDALTGKMIWQNNNSGHLDTRRRKGVSVQGVLTVADGKLWMPGGNIVSPAMYDLASGKCLNDPPKNAKTNRGEEIGVLNDRYIVLGGRLQFSARKNVVNPAYFETHQLVSGKGKGRRKVLNKGRISPAWDDKTIAFVDGRNLMPSCFDVEDTYRYLQQDVRASALPEPLWSWENPVKTGDRNFRTRHTGYQLPGSRDTVSLAIAGNAVVSVYETRGYESHQNRWSVAAHNRDNGSVLWEHDVNPWGFLGSRSSMVNTLSEPALPGGLLIDRDGRVVVVLENGSIVCFGKK